MIEAIQVVKVAKGKFHKWIEPEGLLLLEGWAREGLTDEDIAKKIGISRSTLSEWKKSFPDISDALKKGKEIIDIQVENALLKRALGYSYTELKTKAIIDPKDGGKITEITSVKKEIPPDTTAQIYWLNNRRPDRWRGKQKEETDTAELNKLDEILNEIREEAKHAVHD